MFKINLFCNTSPKNKVNKKLVDVKRGLEGELRDSCSLIDPVIRMKIDDVSTLKHTNYMHIEKFDRWYFITNIVTLRNHIVEISGHVDVLMTYKDDIGKCSAILSRTGNTSKGNHYLDDNLMATYQDTYNVNYAFPHKFSKSGQSLLLSVAGVGSSGV